MNYRCGQCNFTGACRRCCGNWLSFSLELISARPSRRLHGIPRSKRAPPQSPPTAHYRRVLRKQSSCQELIQFHFNQTLVCILPYPLPQCFIKIHAEQSSELAATSAARVDLPVSAAIYSRAAFVG